ncbi:hypothetical protein HHE02_14240 [Helicobacter heilmannii]|uniref:hypothetical protein n=1 Tax=Helicobacter heilmannii TaxID=35817 RepID=UPI0006A212AB|nr:hypothetical protein [Helicobacter heilmannii]CRF48114.1 hypothetical protein HHE02_14240 [Helicobacter heilmannii]
MDHEIARFNDAKEANISALETSYAQQSAALETSYTQKTSALETSYTQSHTRLEEMQANIQTRYDEVDYNLKQLKGSLIFEMEQNSVLAPVADLQRQIDQLRGRSYSQTPFSWIFWDHRCNTTWRVPVDIDVCFAFVQGGYSAATSFDRFATVQARKSRSLFVNLVGDEVLNISVGDGGIVHLSYSLRRSS